MKPHAFIAMPFGTKPDADGKPIDFNRVYEDLLKPALEAADLEVFRADEEQRAGDIRTDMFQELLVADLVVADLTLDNPNVWYELGVRHALRARGVILVQGPRATQPFDIYTDRKLRYRLKDGVPDPATLEADRAAITKMARATLEAWSGRKVSPVYQLLPHLQEPDWRTLLLEQRNEFSDAQERWASRMEVARQKGRPGDILVLAEETPTRALWLEAKTTAGNALLRLKHFDFALEQFDAVLAVEPDRKAVREKKAICLGRLGRSEEALEWVRQLTEDHPEDPECWALAGRVIKDGWIQRWAQAGATPGADARGGRVRGRGAAGSDRAVSHGLPPGSVALLLRHQRADAADAGAPPGRVHRRDGAREPARRRAVGVPDRTGTQAQGLLGARQPRRTVRAGERQGLGDSRVQDGRRRSQQGLVRARFHATDPDAAA